MHEIHIERCMDYEHRIHAQGPKMENVLSLLDALP
jgi:hypothetical protein